MKDIELVVKIPEEVYKQFKKDQKEKYVSAMISTDIIANGTPLPKGHGRLIDVGQCDRKLFYQQCGGADSLITVKTAFDMLMSLSTIVEADREE